MSVGWGWTAMGQLTGFDRLERVAMVEPGVRFGDLQTALEKEGLRLPAPLAPRSSKSVLARYVAARLLWDPLADATRMIREFEADGPPMSD